MLDNQSNSLIHIEPSLSMVFNPVMWNANQESHNCLGYALNSLESGFPWAFHLRRKSHSDPDRLRSQLDTIYKFKKLSPYRGVVGIWLEFCGLERIREHQYNPAKRHIIALTPDGSHFLRLDGDKTWSHKDGTGIATKYDDKENVIESLEKAFLWHENRVVSSERSDRSHFKAWQKESEAIIKTTTDPKEREEALDDARIFKLVTRPLSLTSYDGSGYSYFAIPKQGILLSSRYNI